MIGTLSTAMMTASRMDAFSYPAAPARTDPAAAAPARTGRPSWVAQLFGRRF